MATLIDISYPLENGQLNFADDPAISVVRRHTVASKDYNLAQISLSTHHGTHLDAPFHFFDDGRTLDQIALDRFYGPAHLIDLAPRGRRLEPRTLLTVGRFQAHQGVFQPGARVIYRTGWDQMFGTPEFFTEYPSLSLEAARWIAEKRIALLGMDTPTPSREMKECHHILLAKSVEIVLVEGLARLHLLPPKFTFIGFPLNIKGGDGSPIRAVALVD
jgi:arylformamidase